ncbi:hypothetical protein Ancab_028356 [Ancistrocladus abbreviatus]
MENVVNALSKMSLISMVKPLEYSAQRGAGKVPEGFMAETKEQGLVAIVLEMPVIGLPEWTDQPTNAKLLVSVFGVGVGLWPNQDGVVGSEEFKKCTGEVISWPRATEFREKAAEWKRIVVVMVANDGSSKYNILLSYMVTSLAA